MELSIKSSISKNSQSTSNNKNTKKKKRKSVPEQQIGEAELHSGSTLGIPSTSSLNVILPPPKSPSVGATQLGSVFDGEKFYDVNPGHSGEPKSPPVASGRAFRTVQPSVPHMTSDFITGSLVSVSNISAAPATSWVHVTNVGINTNEKHLAKYVAAKLKVLSVPCKQL